MKKNLIYLLAFLFMGVFVACNNDDDNMPEPTPPAPAPQYTAAELLEGYYEAELFASTATEKDTSGTNLTFALVGSDMVKLTTSSLSFQTIKVINLDSIPVTGNSDMVVFKVENKTINANLTVKSLNGSLKGKELVIQMIVDWKGVETTLNFSGNRLQNNQPIIYGITFNSDAVLLQPQLEGKNFTFYVKGDVTNEQLRLQPVYRLASGAKVNPEAGSVIDFAESISSGKPVKINVVSEDYAKVSSYTMTCMKVVDVNTSMENWVKGVEDQEPDMTFYEVANGWSSSNTGAHFLKAFGGMGIFNATVDYNLVKVEDAQDGKFAAKMVTLNTTLNEMGLAMGFDAMIPGITSGTLFAGKFVTDTENTLNSTKFGVPYFKKPLRFQGYYKYTQGKDYYVTRMNDGKKEVVIDKNQVDAPALNAVLYEVDNYKQPHKFYQEALTGVNLFTSDKIVARAEVKNAGPQANYTAFDIEFEYKKSYDPEKLYMLAIVFASSKDGDKFCGAPESTLIVDNIKIVD